MTTRKHVIYGILGLVSLLGLGITQSAKANFIATMNQVGTDVVVTGSGTIDLTGLSFFANGSAPAAMIIPIQGLLYLNDGPVDVYANISGPFSFGMGGTTRASSSSGDAVGLDGLGSNRLFVPSGYLSGNPLSDTSTYSNATLASVGVTPGTYIWTWGTGIHADSFTLQIVPEPSTSALLGLTGIGAGVMAYRRRK
jgi:hypothetical protein